jgi:hypothetical protein
VCFVTVISEFAGCKIPAGPFLDEEHRDRWIQCFNYRLEEMNDSLQLSAVNFKPIRAALTVSDFWDALTDREDLLRLWRTEDVVAYIRLQYERVHSSNAA